ncbi:MAG TPA: methyltransferase domain-containing protein [Actinophytocola sp.]|jgi:SAM-dependent methyltransferase|uniref:methyltransferase domain-containing protein n=1 Tax=Actinophytocola sp. TaxID=1872138 RepID=UPI002E018C80|nr:methyltransferase domain-containing protein [Actinophytocola sp.]
MNVRHLRSTWESLGEDDPLWAVLMYPERRGGRWETGEFLATGEVWVVELLDMLSESSLRLGNHVLDFGCGVGRLSFALADHVDRVTGVDIAASMVERAQALNQHPDRIRFMHYDGRLLPFEDGTFDSVISMIVLQHAPPAVQLANLLELQRVVRPGGMLALQIPAQPTRPVPLEPGVMRADLVVTQAPRELVAGQVQHVPLRITNTGSGPWPVDRCIRVGNHWLAGGAVAVMDDARVDLPHEIGPGESVELSVPVTAPIKAGAFELEIDLVQEEVTWWGEVGSSTVRLPVEVVGPSEVPPPAPDAEPAETGEYQVAMTMTGIPTRLVRDLLAHCGCTVVRAVPDKLAGNEWESYTYLIRKE